MNLEKKLLVMGVLALLLFMFSAPAFAETKAKAEVANKYQYGESRNKNEKHSAKVYDKNGQVKNHDHKQCIAELENLIFNRVVTFEDINRNGIFDKEEVAVSNVKVSFNDVFHTEINPIQEAVSASNGVVEFVLPNDIDLVGSYYLELMELPAGYQISPEPNSLFGLDNRTAYSAIEVTGNQVVSFGGVGLVYVPLVKSNTTTIEVTTTNSLNSDIRYGGVNYELYQYQMGQFIKIDTQVSDQNGICYFYNIGTEFEVYLRATNLADLGLAPYDGLGADGYSAYIKLTAPSVELKVTAYEV